MRSCCSVVERSKDSRRAFILDERADDRVVKVCKRVSARRRAVRDYSHLIGVHLICSRTYSSCSVLSVNSIKICCSFSLT